MKKTLVALVALAGVASAEVKLLYGYDFNTNLTGLTDTSTLTNLGTGTTSIGVTSATGSAAGSLATSSTKFGDTGNGSYITSENRMISIENANGIGADTTDGFALTFNFRVQGSTQWKNSAMFKIGTTAYTLQVGGGQNSMYLFQGSTVAEGAVALANVTGTDAGEWYTIVLNATSTSLTLNMYSTGETPALVDSQTYTFTPAVTGELTLFQQGGTDRFDANVRVDNFGVYNGVLSDAMAIDLIKYEKTNGTLKTKLVPEPTAATLSLLALAGLAARRRRK